MTELSMKQTQAAPEHQEPLEVVVLTYPGVTMQDYIGPSTILGFFGFFGRVRVFWKNLEPVVSDIGFKTVPNATFAECPERVDVLLVPGGPGAMDMIKDEEVLDFVRACGQRAAYVTSVCTGSLILGAAGLLDGYRATSHWSAVDLLAAYGAIPVRERVVADRNRFSGGGVTAGIDFGLTLLAKIKGEKMAKMAQLGAEYNPQPPFEAGSPETAGPEIVNAVNELIAR